MEKVSIIICTEGGVLENMSKILVSSIRTFGGAFSNSPIFSFQPRKSKKVSASTKKFLEENNVRFIDLELNKEYEFYPLANKPLVCAWAEENLESEVLVFLDSDVVVFDEPTEFLCVENNEVKLIPEAQKGIGSNGKNDKNEPYWKAIYKTLGIEKKRFVNTLIDNQKILPYWNSGLIVSRRESKLFGNWKTNFERIISKKIMPWNGLFFLEQSVLSATITSMDLSVKPLELEYNYPVHLHDRVLKMENNIDLSQMISWHYHDLFSKPGVPESILHFLRENNQGKWLSNVLEKYPLDVSQYARKWHQFQYFKRNLMFKYF